jgi:hypothetical protein
MPSKLLIERGKCGGDLVCVDTCYGMTGGRKYVCRSCQSYIVVGRDTRPEYCMAERVAPSP